jgi:hypothetical protein
VGLVKLKNGAPGPVIQEGIVIKSANVASGQCGQHVIIHLTHGATRVSETGQPGNKR